MKMIKGKRILFLCIGLLLVVVIAITLFIIRSDREEVDWHYFHSEASIESLLFSEVSTENPNDNVHIILRDENFLNDDHRYFPEQYLLVFSEWSGRRRNRVTEIDRYIFSLYDLITKERIREFDVLEILSEFEEKIIGYEIHSNPSAIIEMSGQIYPIVNLNRIGSDNVPLRDDYGGILYMQTLILDIYTGEHRFLDETEDHYWEIPRLARTENERELAIQMSFFGGFWMEGGSEQYDLFLQRNGIDRDGLPRHESAYFFQISRTDMRSDTVRIEVSANNLPTENERLYTLFPGLEQFVDHEDMMINIILTGYPTAEEILSLFIEDDQEISFEGVIMRGAFSIDGEEHEIHSFEDYFRLRDFSEWGEGIEEEPTAD